MNALIEVPTLKAEGRIEMLVGKRMRTEEAPEGFAFCPYNFGTVERSNWIAGCLETFQRS